MTELRDEVRRAEQPGADQDESPAGRTPGEAPDARESKTEDRRQDEDGQSTRWRPRCRRRRRNTSLRLRLVVVFGLVALTAAVSASSIAYWLNREAVLTRTQDAALSDFQQEMQQHASTLSQRPSSVELQHTANVMADSAQHFSVLLVGQDERGAPLTGSSAPGNFTPSDLPASLRAQVSKRQAITPHNKYPYHVFWQRIVRDGTPYLVGGAKVIDGGPTGYMLKSLEPEAKDLDSLAWSLGIATALALVGAALLAQAAATTVLKPVHRLGVAARRLGEGKLDTRLRVSGTDELAELSRTFNSAAASLEKRVADMSAREEASRRFVADMSHELRTPLTAITAVTEVLEEELDAETGGIDPMIEPAVRLVVSETRRLNDLVENLMEVTRFDAGTARLVLDDVDIADQITACIDARAWLDAVDLDAERGIMARIDPRRLDVILANLIGNALKHGGSPVRVSVRTERPGVPSGREHPEHRDAGSRHGAPTSGAVYGSGGDEDGVAAAADGEYVVIAVRDHGPGIPEEVLPHVFDRFYKASASRPRSDGSGLGLSIAQENAHIHGGLITVGNAPDGGAVFTLRLPRHTIPLDERGDGTEAGGRDTGTSTRGRRADDGAQPNAQRGEGIGQPPKTGSGQAQDTGDEPEDVVDGPKGGARAADTDDAEGDT